eukprot:TRINITY_DN13148_c0_g1_i1.p1 TRINITY_DN13148_c0_g1~~TRINITY_DN13148_c0_g1_i1.p1  ORF type:complete len:537 (-),score=221.33 TRINITY_DN13148_c0_g1_i1:259-1869(-)
MDQNWNTRRSNVYSCNGMVSCGQPLAAEIGIRILRNGGNAADAAVAIAAAMNVTQPTSTGIGGDAFMLYYSKEEKKVYGLNGSGRCPSKLNLEYLNGLGYGIGEGQEELPWENVHTITVPGAAACWVDTVEKYGTMSMTDVLQPAIDLAEEGFPVGDVVSQLWKHGEYKLINANADTFLPSPKAGEIFKNPDLAETFRTVANEGKSGFYQGRIADAIIDAIQSREGVMINEDLENHESTDVEPIHVNYKGVDVFEIPPNGQGLTALLALNILENFDLQKYEHNSKEYLHIMIEAMRLAFADARWYIADPSIEHVPVKELLSKEYAKTRADLIDLEKAQADVEKGSPFSSSDTVVFTVVDPEGNACCFINSNYHGFGSGIVPEGCGFTLQNRGKNFSLDPNHPNHLAPNKRSYHTIIPGLALKNGELYCSFGVMGGFMQPQGHAQMIVNMVDFNMSPQQSLNCARFCISPTDVSLEDGIPEETINQLKEMGHIISNNSPVSNFERYIFGRGYIIKKTESNSLQGGCDPRSDGITIGF